MKKKLLLAILTLALACATVLCISAETPKVIQPGDVNGDGEINAVDLVLLSQYIAGWDVILGGDSHTVVIDPAVPATCTQTGLTEGKHCSDCGMILVKQQVIPTKHEMEESFVQPTTTTQGYTLIKCKLCGYEEKKDFIPPVNSNGLAVEVNTANMTCVITGIGTCTDTDINIPAKISDYTVVGIADKAFSEQTQITSITIPDTVKTLGQRAFYGCTGLTEFTVPASVTSVGHQVFYKCDNLATVYYNSSFSPDQDKVFLNIPSIKTVVFGGEFVPYSVAYKCANIEKVSIEKGVTKIGGYAFYGCSNLTNVTIPNSLTYIGERAFLGCGNLNVHIDDIASWMNITFETYEGYYSSHPFYSSGGSLYIDRTLVTDIIVPNYITNIGDGTFYKCNSLSSVIVSDNVTKIGEEAFRYCINLTSIVIPDSLETIERYAFYGCSSLVSVNIPNNVECIEMGTFYGCCSLKNVTIPDSVASIGVFAFYDCVNLLHVIIPDSVTEIGQSAFQNCGRLTSVTIPDSVTTMGRGVFYNCSRLESITLSFIGNGGNETHFGYIFGASSCSYNRDYVPSSLKTIILTGSSNIYDHAFFNCSSLESIIIPDSVVSIGDYAFYGTSLLDISIPDSVASIGSYAFAQCSLLMHITIPSSLKSIGYDAFNGCDWLENVYYEGDETDWSKTAIGSNNLSLTSATRYYYSAIQPTTTGNYWRYVDGKPTPW